MVVLQEEDLGRLVAGREHERFADIALAGGAVAEVRDDGFVLVGVAGADLPVERDPHGVARRVQGLRPDHQRVEVEVAHRRIGRVPAAVGHAPQQREDADRVDAADHADGVLAIRREDAVLRAGRIGGTDLRPLLAPAGHPQSELALALQVGALLVEGAHLDHVAVHPPVVVLVETLQEGQVLHSGVARLETAVWGQQLDRVRRARVIVRGSHLSNLTAWPDAHLVGSAQDQP